MTSHRDGELMNRTGVATAPERAEQMIAAVTEFPPSSQGDAQAMAEVRVTYAQQTQTFEGAKAAAGDGASKGELDRSALLMDKLGERLGFERTGARLYEGLVSKRRAYGSFDGGPEESDLEEILEEEHRHFQLLRRVMDDLGGDPTAVTPSANLVANATMGFPAVIADPRTTLLDGLLRLPGGGRGHDDQAELHERHDQCGSGDHAEEHAVPIVHRGFGVPGACGGFALLAWL